MSNKKKSVRTFKGMGYRLIQRKNSRNRQLLTPENQTWLKKHNYRNIGWDNVIKFFEKVTELLQQETVTGLSLEELFLEADRVGHKYLDNHAINERNYQIAQELGEIADLLDARFPSDQKMEVIDYGK